MNQQAITELLDLPQEVDGRALLHCRSCHQAVTAEGYRIQMEGAHQHRFINPSGQVYDVCCFQWAPGATISGRATTEYSWFADYLWQYARCEECAAQLGWFYDDGSDAFFGLIPSKLIGLG